MGILVPLDVLFQKGVKIPDSGKLYVQIEWGSPCHGDHLDDAPEGRRFASWEHIICARYIGKSATGDDAKKSYQYRGTKHFLTSQLKLPVGAETP